MQRFRSSWRYPAFWLLVSALAVFVALQFQFTRDIGTKFRDLYTILLRGDLTLLEDKDVLKETGLFLLYASLMLTVGFYLAIHVLRLLHMVASHRYEVTPSKVIARHGIVARDYREAYRIDLRNVHIRQGFLDRLLVAGDLTLSTSGPEGLVIYLKKVASPFSLKREITAVQSPALALPAPPEPATKAPAPARVTAPREPKAPTAFSPPSALLDTKRLSADDDADTDEPATQITHIKSL